METCYLKPSLTTTNKAYESKILQIDCNNDGDISRTNHHNNIINEQQIKSMASAAG